MDAQTALRAISSLQPLQMTVPASFPIAMEIVEAMPLKVNVVVLEAALAYQLQLALEAV